MGLVTNVVMELVTTVYYMFAAVLLCLFQFFIVYSQIFYFDKFIHIPCSHQSLHYFYFVINKFFIWDIIKTTIWILLKDFPCKNNNQTKREAAIYSVIYLFSPVMQVLEGLFLDTGIRKRFGKTFSENFREAHRKKIPVPKPRF